jgi:predicted DNA-binding transcriptional regulator YafY
MFAIVLELQARGVVRGSDLAERFETSVRTIYRDVLALCECGVPVVSMPGRGYALPDDYFLPPLSLGLDEAVALALGADYVAKTLEPTYRGAARSARAKIATAVPRRLRAPFEQTRNAFHLVGRLAESEARHVRDVRDAIVARNVLLVRYRGRRTDDAAGRGDVARRIAPYGLAHVGGVWYLVGHSYERDVLRRFRLSRIETLEASAERFEMPAGFVLAHAGHDSGAPSTIVRVAFDARNLVAMRERLEAFADVTIAADGDAFVATFSVRGDALDFADRVLAWGGSARVIEPYALRERVAATARRIADAHDDGRHADTTVATALS